MNAERGYKFLEELPTLNKVLPFDPELLQVLFSMTGEDSKASLIDIADAVSADQGLTTHVLTIANSAYYGMQSEVTSIARALSLLGLAEIRKIIISQGFDNMAADLLKPNVFDYKRYWDHQVAASDIAAKCAKMLGMNADDISTAALLHDIGKLFTAILRPEDWLAIEEIAAKESRPFREIEDAYWSVDHCLVGAMVLNSWNLPKELTEPINWHHSPEFDPGSSGYAMILELADSLAHEADVVPSPTKRSPEDIVELLEARGHSLDLTQIREKLLPPSQSPPAPQSADKQASS
jgi:putative nucleotidyltransferase with HDIG domain